MNKYSIKPTEAVAQAAVVHHLPRSDKFSTSVKIPNIKEQILKTSL